MKTKMTAERIADLEWLGKHCEGKQICLHCEYYGTKYQYLAKKKTCINPESRWHGCKRDSGKTCNDWTTRKDGRMSGIPAAWYRSREEE